MPSNLPRSSVRAISCHSSGSAKLNPEALFRGCRHEPTVWFIGLWITKPKRCSSFLLVAVMPNSFVKPYSRYRAELLGPYLALEARASK
ncbi:MAG TPA: hypothetical protein VFG30_16075 [Polyangiales bacterium]|nr:hypothetical protein [Polyangiales bacterium]